MKEAIRMVLESIYDPEDTVHFRSGQGCHSVLKRIKEEWGSSRWFLEFDIRKCFHTIDRHRLIQILKEAIADPKFFYSIQKVFSAGRLIGVERGPYSVPHSVLLSALLGNIYLNKLDQEIDFLRNKYEIPIVHKVRLLRAGRRIDDQEARFSTPQDNRALILGKSMPSEAHFHSLVSSWHTPSSLQLRGDQKKPFVSSLEPALIVPSSLLCAAFLIEVNGLTPRALFYVKECNNWAMKYYCKRKSPLIELGRESILVIRPERVERKQTSLKTHYLSRICYARYADDLLLGIVGAIELLLEIQKRIAHFLQSGLNLWVGSSTAGSTTIAARSTVEFLGTVIREVSPRPTPIQFLRELEKRLRVKHRIHITTCHLRSGIHSKFKNLGNSIPKLTKGMIRKYRLAETLARVRSPSEGIVIQQESGDISVLHNSGRSNASLNQVVSQSDSGGKFLLSTSTGQKSLGGGGHWVRSISDEFPIKIEAPIKKILRRLRNRGLISRKRPWPIHVACLTNASDEDIVNWFAGIAISLLSYYRGCNNLYQVRTIVDHQIRWSAIFTLAHKHKSSARNIIPKYSKDLNILNQEGGKILAEFPNSLELGKLGPGQGLSKNSTIQNS